MTKKRQPRGRSGNREQSPLMSIEEAAAYLGVSRNTMYAEAQNGNVPIHRIRKRIFVVRPLLDEQILRKPSENPEGK